jgi:thiol-disulfide isomerase/thioredoxin
MGEEMRKILLFLVFLATVLTLNLAFAAGETALLSPGDKFPNLALLDQLEKQDKEYLGIKIPFFSFMQEDTFKLDEVKAELLFIEFFNKYCTSCQRQAPVNNEIYKRINSDNDLKNRVKFIGIGVGNSKRELDSFKSDKTIPFPLIPDQEFLGYEEIGDPGGTPYMLLVKKTDLGFVVFSSHMGLNKDKDFFVKQIKEALITDVAKLEEIKKAAGLKTLKRKLVLNMSEEEIVNNVKTSVAKSAKNNLTPEKIITTKLNEFDGLYVSKVYVNDKQEILYSKILSRKPVCDVCHGIHFIVTFDIKGFIRDIYAIHLTKYGNEVWTEEEINKVNHKLVGTKISEEIKYNYEVDAVTTATITTSLMYNSIKRLSPLVEQVRQLKVFIK